MHDRIERVRAKMRELNLDALVVSSRTNIRYLTGFSGSNGLAVVTHDNAYLITDNRYRDQAPLEAPNAEIFIAVENLYRPLKGQKLLQNCKRTAFEANHLSFRGFSHLRDIAPNNHFIATENLIEKIVAIKSRVEIDKIQAACLATEKTWAAVLPMLRPGMAEVEIVSELYYQGLRNGATAMAFEPIVASGKRSALPHGTATSKSLQPGDFVVIDFGCEVDGLKSDMTRTVFVGEPTADQRQMYEAVKTANALAFSSIRINMKAAELDKIVRDRLTELGFEKEFSHSLGHGFGLGIHEMPRIGQKSKDWLLPNSVFTIEPGVYVPDMGGVRIEDDVLLAEDTPQLLTHIGRELVTID